ncbi:Xyloglucan endotransglucosylase/hydrolase protein 3 [Abeliophyllum distichum]|uniref:Xyloglucan endotransglucosylase/hydrolase protein 3 n=1 Tax=Abeliophyllum distichum TaxID=126358 RepID=A0ABD1V760_9LAMI
MWGGDHVTVLDQGREVQLLIDEHLGAGFNSKQEFGSGYFRMMMKLPSNNSRGVITTFYLTSIPVGEKAINHDELDFEFLGGSDPMAYTLNTNVFANDQGHREQQFRLWFDPTADFHKFFIDGTPIRVFKNNTNIGVSYPSKSMHIEACIWNRSEWQGPVDWSQGPFVANYRGFAIDGCNYNTSNPEACYYIAYYWNAYKYWQLSPDQQTSYQHIRNKFMVYDYCSNNAKNFPECLNNFPVEESIQEDMNNTGFDNFTVNCVDTLSNSGGTRTSTLRKGAASFVPNAHDFQYAQDAFGHKHVEIDKGLDIPKTGFGPIMAYSEKDGEGT